MTDESTAPSRRLRLFRLEGSGAIWLYNFVLVAAGVSLWAGVLRGLGPSPAVSLEVPWWGLALVFYIVESYVVHVHFRREAHTISFSEVGLVLGLYLVSPTGLLLAQLVGGGAALAFHRRQRPVKLTFNLAQSALTTAAALLVFRGVTDLGSAYGPVGWTAAVAATVAASLLGIVLVTVVIAIAQGEWTFAQLPTTATISTTATVTTATLVLIAIELARVDALAVVLLAVPAAMAAAGIRIVTGQHRRQEHLQFLYESMQKTQGAPEFGLAVAQLLSAVRHLVRAEYAEIFLFAAGNDQGLRSRLSAGGEMLMRPDKISAGDRLVLDLAAGGSQLFLLPVPRPEHPLDACLSSRNLVDGMITVLGDEQGPFGVLVVGERAGDVGTFTQDDARLLETFAGHASVLIENGRLERSLAEVTELQEKLRHQAFHDALTGLPNRALFVEQVEVALADASDKGKSAAVLFLDLDDFKAINDTRGHAVGDELLTEVGQRIRNCARSSDLPARLGGDEFAVLVEMSTEDDAQIVADRVLEALAQPFILSGRETYVHASVGIAPASSAASGDELLRNADVAMYAAKQSGKNRFSVYQPVMHGAVRKRHLLSLELEHAVERGEIGVVFQPIYSLRTNAVVSFEALARWYHPERGTVAPNDFIPIAEHALLMPAIGQHVLQEACRAAREWQSARPEYAGIGVAVNLSPSELANERLADLVARTVLVAGLAPSSLTIEITETTAMSDIDAMCARMHELRALGVRLALDDFGTGHSSLERLDTMPLDMLKIPKPFIDKLLDAYTDPSFVDAFVRLGNALGLESVAEGIEHEIQIPRLLDRGCGFGQGFHLAKPMAAGEIADFLETATVSSAAG